MKDKRSPFTRKEVKLRTSNPTKDKLVQDELKDASLSERHGRYIVPMDKIEQEACELLQKHEKVTPKQAELVHLLLYDGMTVNKACKIMDTDNAWGYKTMKKQHVLEYARELGERVLGVHALRALHCVSDLLTSKSDYVRLEASKDILDRAGIGIDSSSNAPMINFNIVLD